ncbi:uncharacterized protein LOC129200850 isoform X2 [Grus americana]|uniref:uncharacterized protein LOC129200850 isoform X2 n=1 Tax=Grus americana TaxID=9117 RepID=UPI0024078D71|nr:uncharacterized protein LOC129200850 isoform X2 [Grus americana]
MGRQVLFSSAVSTSSEAFEMGTAENNSDLKNLHAVELDLCNKDMTADTFDHSVISVGEEEGPGNFHRSLPTRESLRSPRGSVARAQSAQRGSTPGVPSTWDASGGRARRPHPLASWEPARRTRPSATRTAASTCEGAIKVSQQERESRDRGREHGQAGKPPFPIEISPELAAASHPGTQIHNRPPSRHGLVSRGRH